MSNKSITTSPDAETAKAKLVTGTEGADNSIVFKAKEPGVEGNSITVKLTDPPGNNVTTSVAVSGKDIDVTLGTDGSSAVNATADAVMDAINGSTPAKALITVEEVGASSGNGVVAPLAKTPLAGGKAVKVSSVETTTVITDPEDPKAVQIPEQADATGRDELAVHSEQSPLEQIADF